MHHHDTDRHRAALPRPFPALSALIAALACTAAAVAQAPLAHDPLVSVSSGGVAAVDDALARLGQHRRLLMIAAHPDDEDTFLLTLVEKDQHGEAAYLSTSRGEGGQNLIGEELGEGLGLLRSRELEAARRIDGADQYFSRTYDFGFTRSMDETFRRWPREAMLEDTMRVVRRHRPQVLVAVFPPTEAAGHGQHQVSGWLAEQIFELSRRPVDPFPELGLEPWPIESLFRAAWFRPQQATLRLPLGSIDASSGRSIFQTALLSRSQHRCQDMGFEQPPGDAEDAVTWLAGRGGDADQVPGSPDVFAGVETSLGAIAASLEDAELRASVAAELAQIEELALQARGRLVPMRLGESTKPLAEIVTRLVGLVDGIGEAEAGDGRAHARALLEEKLAIARRGLAAAAGVMADAVTDRELVRPGDSFEARLLLWRSQGELADVEMWLESPADWTVGEAAPADAARGFFTARASEERTAQVSVPAGTNPDVPYFLEKARQGDLFDWSGTDPDVKTRAFGPPPLLAHFAFTIDGAPVELVRELVHRRRDQALGEVRRPLRVVPSFEVSLDRPLIVWPNHRREPETLRTRIRSHVPEATTVRLETSTPAGWPEIGPVDVDIDALGKAEVELAIEPPAELDAGAAEIRVAVRHQGRRYERAYRPVDYPHIRPSTLPVDARTSLRIVDLVLPRLDRVAYVRGASDRVPELLAAVGVPIELLGADELLITPLAGFDAVVLGPRAFEVEAALAAANQRLLDYARGGGLVIVQYQQYGYSRGGFAPLPLEIDRPHDRITDEGSAVRLALPEHRVFHLPNRIGEHDWQGWVQERGLYFAGTFDPAWQTPLAMTDQGPSAEEQLGGLLIAELGAGHYVYTGLSFFRQLPAGVSGAYRLFGNLLALASDAGAGAGAPIAHSDS